MPPMKRHRPNVRGDAPERWAVNAMAADVATLDIPAHARRQRRFDVDCRFVVQRRAGSESAWLEMKVYANGSLEWTRRIDMTGESDSLDYHFRREVPNGQALRIVLSSATQGAQRVQLSIDAEEV